MIDTTARNPFASGGAFAVLLVAALLAADGVARAEQLQPPVVQTGERLPPAAFGATVIESMDDVIARDAARAAQPEPARRDRPRNGLWIVPSMRATYFPRSGLRNIVNQYGDTRMGIGFGRPVRFDGVYVAGQGAPELWTPALRVIGYRDGRQVAESNWFHGIGDRPVYFAADMDGVDRIVFESVALVAPGGFYALDDLTFTDADTGRSVTLDFEDLPHGQVISGTGYADLTWEIGEGIAVDCADVVPAPQAPPGLPPPPLVDDDDLLLFRAGTAPLLTLNFQGVRRGDAGQFSYPPDTCGAIGPTQFVITVNRNFAVYDKATGAVQTNVSLTSFLPGSSGDPRVLFDQHAGRWIVLNDDFNARLYLAVSLTDNAMGSWFKTSFLVTGGVDGTCWPDYPTLGVDANGLYTGAYMVGCQMSLFVIDKAPLVATPPSMGTVTAFRALPWEGALQPTHTYGNPPGQYIVSTHNFDGIRVRRVDPPMNNPTLTELGIVPVTPFQYPNGAQALGGPALDTIDTRLMNAVYMNGSIWTAHTVRGGPGAACRWYQLAEGEPFTLVQSGIVGDTSRYHFFPSIAVNDEGHAVLGCSGSKATEYAGCYYAGRLVNDPPGQMSAPILLKAGIGPQNNIDGYGRNRWGDYSLTTLDPSDGRTIWTIQEYADVSNIWGTWVGKLQHPTIDPTPPGPAPELEIPPTADGPYAMTMRSTLVEDDDSPPVQYQFDYVSGFGGHDSAWQFSRDYTDTGLTPNAAYTYRVRARDNAAPNQNMTPYSSTATGSTAIETPTGVVADVGQGAVALTATGTFTHIGFFSTRFYFEVTPDPGPGTGANEWVPLPTHTLVNLAPCTEYTVRAKARNFQAIETPFTDPVPFAVPGCTCALPGDVNGDSLVDGADIAGFVRVKLGNALPGDSEPCADFGGPTFDDDLTAFIADLLAP